jgi:hypothetical protein
MKIMVWERKGKPSHKVVLIPRFAGSLKKDESAVILSKSKHTSQLVAVAKNVDLRPVQQ